jgi:hypothetical protein
MLFGCASNGIQSPSGESAPNVLQVFKDGDVRLNCQLSCSGAWGWTRRNAKSLYNNALWKDLAIEVAKVGFQVDQTYYYLGRAAEGLGYLSAAQTYYKLALASDYKCAGIINNCDGLVFPRDILARLDNLEPKQDSPRPVANNSDSQQVASNKLVVRPELPTESVASSQAPTAAVDNSAPLPTRPDPTYKSGKAVQTTETTSQYRSNKNSNARSMGEPSNITSEVSSQAVYALKKLEARTQSGISYRDYGPALGETKFAVNMYLESPDRDKNPQLAAYVDQTMTTYTAAGMIWDLKFHGLIGGGTQDFIPVGGRLGGIVGSILQDYPNLDLSQIKHTIQNPVTGENIEDYYIEGMVTGLFGEASKRLGLATKLFYEQQAPHRKNRKYQRERINSNGKLVFKSEASPTGKSVKARFGPS